MFRREVLLVLLWMSVVHDTGANLKLEPVAGGFVRPLFALSPPGDTNRFFVLEQHAGRVRIINLQSNTVQPGVFLVVSNLLTGNEQGLLGMAFHPGYATNGFFYVNYVRKGGPAGTTEITRYRAGGDPALATAADPASKKVILSFTQPQENHNGGWLGFGPDGFLYISTGDGGGANDQHGTPGNGQSRSTLLGKILRIDVDSSDPYGIPDGNPYKGSLSLRNEIWAYGLRNPWRCSFDRETGDLWIGDVGQDAREEIDLIPTGASDLNFGWRPREGSRQNSVYPTEQPVTPAVAPVYDYPHPTGNSVTGGYVYRGQRIPELQGKYLFGDFVSGRFWELTPSGTNATTREITSELNSPRQVSGLSSFGEDATGELYVCDLTKGNILRITSSTPTGIRLTAQMASGEELHLTFPAANGQSYVLESATRFGATNNWTNLTDVPAGTARTVTLTNSVTGSQRYFRLRAP